MLKRLICVAISVLMLFSMFNVLTLSAYAESDGTATTDEATKDEVNLVISEEEIENGSIIGIMGDADTNNKVNIKDATAIQKYIANLIILSQRQLALADSDNSSKINVKDATSVQKFLAGYEVKSVINHTLYEVGEHSHSYLEASIVANCIRNGYTLVSCVCGEEYKENETPATGHNYTDRIVNATCTEDGYIEFKCENCSYRYTEIYGEKTGHVNTELRNRIYPTATSTGYTGDTYCIDCGTLLEKGKVVDKLPSVSNDSDDIPSYTGVSDAEQYAFNRMNEIRKAEGLKPYKWNDTIHAATNIRANEHVYWETVGGTYFAHNRPDGTPYWTVFEDIGVDIFDYKHHGENLTITIDKFSAVESWMESTAGHREAVLSSEFTHVTISIVKASNDRYYACAIFTTPFQ